LHEMQPLFCLHKKPFSIPISDPGVDPEEPRKADAIASRPHPFPQKIF
jgi:hypothetical protein